MNNAVVYLNGAWSPLSEARVSVLDRGFLFGDGVYEVVPVYGQRLFRFAEHMARLDRSLKRLRMANPHGTDEWLRLCRQLLEQAAATPQAPDQLIYIQVTRGVAARDHVMPVGIEPTVFMMCNPMKPWSKAQRLAGVACITARDFRWERGDIKSISLLGNVLARQMSADQGAVETILLRDGWLTEASASNVWLVQDGALLGPPSGEHVLEGIRYALLRELCEDGGIPYRLQRISQAQLLAADEILLSSASKEVLAVTQLDGQPVGNGAHRGRSGPVCERLYDAYQRAKSSLSV